MSIRQSQVLAVTLVVLMALSVFTAAQTQKLEGRFTGTAVNLKRVNGETITIDLIRWSSDADRDRVLTVVQEKGPNELAEVLQKAPSLGYIWRSGSGLGHFVRYAHRVKLPDGGERVILATDRGLGDWQGGPAVPPPAAAGGSPTAASAGAGGADYPFTVIELRITPKGSGEGKMSLSTKVIADVENKTIALENYQGAPMVLKGVKREQTTSAS